MPFLRQSTAQTVRFGPCLDKTDGVTEETALTLAQADMRLSKDGGAFAQKSAAGNATHDSDGWYSTSLSTTDTAAVGELILNVHQPANMLPIWLRWWVLEEVIYDALFGASAAGFDANQRVDVGGWLGTAVTISTTSAKPEVDMKSVSDDETAADNLEATYDGTGYADDQAPSTQSQLSGLTNVGSAVNRAAASYVLTTGTQSANTVSSVAALDGTRHEHTDAAGVMELYYEFLIGAGIPSSVTVTGYLNSNNDDLEVYGYDWIAAAFVRIGTLNGKNASTNEVNAFDLFVDMVGSGSDFGKVRVQFKDGAFTLTSATLAIDQIFVAFSQQAGGYDGGAVWLDTTLSNTNTVPGVDGITTNPVSTIGAVNTLLASQNLSRVHVAPNSSVTFAASQENQEFEGLNWNLALGGQSVSNSHITGADVSGIMTAATEAHFDHCEMDDCTLGSAHIDACDISGDLTFSAAANYFILGCYHSKSTSPVIDFGAAVGNTTLHVHDYHGAMTVKNMGQVGTDVLHFSSPDGKLTLDSTNIGGTVNLNGTFDLVNNGSGQTINDDGAVIETVDGIQTDLSNATDGLGALKALLDAVPTTAMRGTDSAATATNLATVDTVVDAIKDVTDLLVSAATIARLILPQVNTALSNITFEMFDDTDHNPKTGLTVTGQVSLNSGAYAGVSGAIAEIANGTYQFDALAADMNAASVTLRFSSSGADDTYIHIRTAA